MAGTTRSILADLFGPWAAWVGGVQFVFGIWSFIATRAGLNENDWRHADYYLPNWGWLGWTISITTSLLAIVVWNGVRIIHGKDSEIAALKAADDLPNFQFVEAAGTALRRKAYMAVGTSSSQMNTPVVVGEFWTLQARFKNVPTRKTSRSDATNVSATLHFFRPSESRPHLEFVGRWVTKAGAASHVGADETADKIDIPANNIAAKLYIALKPAGKATAFGYAQENIHESNDGSHPKYALPDASYRLRVLLSCSQAEQELWFRLSTNGPDAEPLKLMPTPNLDIQMI
jgi:hypothetical protein